MCAGWGIRTFGFFSPSPLSLTLSFPALPSLISHHRPTPKCAISNLIFTFTDRQLQYTVSYLTLTFRPDHRRSLPCRGRCHIRGKLGQQCAQGHVQHRTGYLEIPCNGGTTNGK